jgi:putative transposase
MGIRESGHTSISRSLLSSAFWTINAAQFVDMLQRVPRMPRFFAPDLPLHIVQRGNNRMPIFASPADFTFFYRVLGRSAQSHGVAVHAYVLMNNHFHLLGTPSRADSVPKMMQSLGRIYVAYFNERYARTGTLWEGRYKAAIVEDERYLLTCMRYIELNPVRAGMLDEPVGYPWSSFRANARGWLDPLVTPHSIYEQMGASPGERQAAYRWLFGSEIRNRELCEIRDATQNGWALGSGMFQRDISLLGRRGQRLRRGRRPKAAVGDKKSTPNRSNEEIRL